MGYVKLNTIEKRGNFIPFGGDNDGLGKIKVIRPERIQPAGRSKYVRFREHGSRRLGYLGQVLIDVTKITKEVIATMSMEDIKANIANQQSRLATYATYKRKKRGKADASGYGPTQTTAAIVLMQKQLTDLEKGPTEKPVCTTNPATSIDDSSATLNGRVDPKGSETAASFEWGKTTAYGNRIDCGNIGSATPAVVKAILEDLNPNTTYHFRVTASSFAGQSVGNDMFFSTTSEAIREKIADAYIAVETAENEPIQSNINTAQTKVTALSSGTDKTELQDRIDAVKQTAAVTAATAAVTAATAAVRIAEGAPIQSNINTAQTKVTALPDSSDKTDLQDRIDAIKSEMTKRENAETAVETAKRTSKQDDKDIAQSLIDSLPSGEFRRTLQNKIDAIKTIETRQQEEEAVAEDAVIAYEYSPITTIENVALTEALQAPARAAVLKVTNTTAKSSFNTRISTHTIKVSNARTSITNAGIAALVNTGVPPADATAQVNQQYAFASQSAAAIVSQQMAAAAAAAAADAAIAPTAVAPAVAGVSKTVLIIGGVIAAAIAAFFIFKKKKG